MCLLLQTCSVGCCQMGWWQCYRFKCSDPGRMCGLKFIEKLVLYQLFGQHDGCWCTTGRHASLLATDKVHAAVQAATGANG